MSNIVYLLLILDNFSHALGATQVLCLEGARQDYMFPINLPLYLCS